MYKITDIFELNHAQTTIQRPLNSLPNIWKSWEEKDATVISKTFSPVWDIPLVSVTEEILKSYAEGWSSSERIEYIRYDVTVNKTDEERRENNSRELQQSVSQETYVLLYLKSNPRVHDNQMRRCRRAGIQ